MNFENSLYCIYYNLLSNFYIMLNMFFPYYDNDILNLQYKTIEYINEDIIFENNSRKRKRFNIFIENLINKNNELIEQIKLQEEEDNDINNYQKLETSNTKYDEIIDSESTESSTESSQEDDEKKNN